MNRNQRKYGRTPKRNDSDARDKGPKAKNGTKIEEVLSPKNRRETSKDLKSTNRCCFVAPSQIDTSQLTDAYAPTDEYQNLLIEQYGFDPLMPDTIKQIKELKRVLCGAKSKVETGSQYVDADNCTVDFMDTFDGSQWQTIDNPEDIERFITQDIHIDAVEAYRIVRKIEVDSALAQVITGHGGFSEYLARFKCKDNLSYICEPGQSENLICSQSVLYSGDKVTKSPSKEPLHTIRISEVPRVKLIAEKFSRYKKNNVELRKLEEKVVCLEYDVYDQTTIGDNVKPVQIMRVFFSIKPVMKGENDIVETTRLPSEIKRSFKVTDEDLKKFNEKEVEIIDEKIQENKPYLDDLKKILRRRQTATKKNKTALDLLSLYEMAKNEYSPINIHNSNTNFLSKAELQEVKDLILANCKSSVHGISRRTIRNRTVVDDSPNVNVGIISQSIVAELMRENGKINVFQ